MEARGQVIAAVEETAPSERKRLGRIGGVLCIIGSLAAAPAAAFIDPTPHAIEYLIAVGGVLAGVAFMFIPWERLPERTLYLIPVGATFYVALGVLRYSDDFAFYMVLIAVYTAYVVRARVDFLALMGFFTVVTVAQLIFVGETFDERAHHILVTLPVMIVSAAVVRYLRNALAQRELQYRRFAVEAVTLAERIRGEPVPAQAPTADTVEERLAELASKTPD